MKYFYVVFSMFLLVISASLHANIIQNKCILKISEVLADLPSIINKENTVVAFDWDSTLAKWVDHQFRAFETRETAEDGTLAVINAIQNFGINHMMVLTARLGGFRAAEISRSKLTFQQDAENHSQNMLSMLGEAGPW